MHADPFPPAHRSVAAGALARWLSLGLGLGLAAIAHAAPPADWQRDAELACINAPVDARSDCINDKLALRAAQAQATDAQAALQPQVDRIVARCRALPVADRGACVGREAASVPGSQRVQVDTAARAQLASVAPADTQRQAACRQAGLVLGAVRVGYTAAQVLDCGWGAPASKREVMHFVRKVEVWTYGPGRELELEHGKVTVVREPRPAPASAPAVRR